jgi:hypothetical protein
MENNVSQIVLLLGIPLVVAAGVILAVSSSVRESGSRRRFLLQNGFTSCRDDKDALEARVRELIGDPRTCIQVLCPHRRLLQGRPVHFFTLHQRRDGQDGSAARVFLLALPRRTDLPCLLFLKPEGLKEGWVTRGLRALIKVRSGNCAGGLAPLRLPEGPEPGNLLGAVGPRGASIHDLIDRAALRVLLDGGGAGFLTVHLRGNDCLLEHPINMRWDLDQAWAFITRLDRHASGCVDRGLPAAS